MTKNTNSTLKKQLFNSLNSFSEAVNELSFDDPITHIYNPLDYAKKAHDLYLSKYALSPKKIIFLGMNPGPWGMAQVGVPFGEVQAVSEWLGINTAIERPTNEHPKRPIEGFSCKRSEVSGRRLWGLFQERYTDANAFFEDHFVANYCPLVFMKESGKNFTPDKLPKAKQLELYHFCDEYLRALVTQLKASQVIGIGAFAQKRAQEALQGMNIKIAKVLHPSPASPAANRGWAAAATKQLIEQGIWSD